MRNREIVFERSALYEEVWTAPLTTLAKKYGLSDNGLRKVCKAMSIPIPEHGHWAKVSAGHDVSRKPLPTEADRTTFTSRPAIETSPYKDDADTAFYEARIAFEDDERNRIDVETPPHKWHPVVIPLRDSLHAAAAKIPQMRRDAELREKSKVWREPNLSGMNWAQFLHGGQLLAVTSALRVSQGTMERALAIVNALCWSANARGFQPSFDDQAGRLVLAGYSATIEVRLSERLDEKWEKKPGWNGKLENTRSRVPSGELRLYIGGSYSERQLTDGKLPLEKQLNEVFRKAASHIVKQRQQSREREAWNREWEARKKREEQVAERRRQLEARKQKLLADAKDWHDARRIREYLDAVVASQGEGVSDEWMNWARAFANHLDPLFRPSARPDSAENL